MGKWSVTVAAALLATSIPATAQAESLLATILRAGQKPSVHSKQRSDKSPIDRKVVRFDEKVGANTIIIDTSERRLYYTLGNGKAVKYGVGVGREGFAWSGTKRISRKAEWPGWTPPDDMRKRQPWLPAHMEGGPGNPLGARALYLGSTLYRIHGTNEAHTIGRAVSSGCIRMLNNDVTDLYERVSVGTRVVVLN